MKFLKVTTFRMATSPITLISCAFGLGSFDYPLGRPRRVLFFCWSAVCLISFCYIIWKLRYKKDPGLVETVGESLTITLFSNQFFHSSCTLVVIEIVCLGQLRSKNLASCIHELTNINGILNAIGIPGEYGSLFKFQIIELIVIFLYISLLEVLANLDTADDIFTQIGHIFALGYMLIIDALVDCTFGIYIRYLGNRFRHINEYLVKSIDNKETIQPFMENSSPDRDILMELESTELYSQSTIDARERGMIRVFINAKKMHHDLCTAARKLNETFGVSIVLSLLVSFFGIVVCLYFKNNLSTNNPISRKIDFITVSNVYSIWIIFFSIKIIHLVSTCSNTSNESQRTRKLLHQLIEPTTNITLREEIHAFLTELNHDPLRFIACGFLNLDYSLITGMINTMTTYSIILLQFHNAYAKANTTRINVTHDSFAYSKAQDED